jgi:hypothetical protein
MADTPPDLAELRQMLDAMARRQLEQAADLSQLLTRFDQRQRLAEETLRDVRLTLTGIGSLAKSLAERQETHEDILRSLAATLAHQDTINERHDALVARQEEFNRLQVDINTDTKTTLARIETLLARMLRTEDNGR